jgi:alpha-D-ribose 1-methylphosphonate 5-triphosphate diphosphatase
MNQAANASGFRIVGGRSLIGGRFVDSPITLTTRGMIGEAGSRAIGRCIDAAGLLVLPGIVDIHGDAFERQMMPRPGVHFALDLALLESDRQAVSNGITTFHGVTWSWEPGLRDADNARSLLATIERLRSELAADTRFHLRHETYNLDAEEEIAGWLAQRRIHLLAFNDHMTAALKTDVRMVERAGVSREQFDRVVERVHRRRDEVPASITRLAAAATLHGVALLSHDDVSPAQRRWYRSLGCRVAEFPTTFETAQEAAASGDDIVFGAPNVVRGGSHVGHTDAREMIACGLCSVLASDYYYPAPLLAAFRLVTSGTLALEQAWAFCRSVRLHGFGRRARSRGDPRNPAALLRGRRQHRHEVWRRRRTAYRGQCHGRFRRADRA